MIINTNMAALNTYRQLSMNEKATQSSLAKLSSGYKINTAADNAAGLAISEKMRGQISGLNQASANAQDGISLVQTAEGALNETTSILQRMRELAVQSSNDTNTTDDRNAMQQEITQLKSEIDRIANTTQFNTKNLLDGSIGNSANITGTDGAKLVTASVADAGLAADTYRVTEKTAATLATTISTNNTGITAANIDLTAATAVKLDLGNYTLNVQQGTSSSVFDVTLVDANGATVASANDVNFGAGTNVQLKDASGTVRFSFLNSAGLESNVQAAVSKSGTTYSMNFNLNATFAGKGDFSITNSAGKTDFASATNLKITSSNFQVGGFQFAMTTDIALAAAAATVGTNINTTNNALTMQIGANQGQTMQIAVGKMDTTSLGVDAIDVSTQAGAETAITAVNSAIEQVSLQRSSLGAFQNRLDHTINNLGTSSQNITSAEASIRDVDMAQEMTNFTKNNILQQAAQAMLAQANQQPQGVLQLLR